MSAPPGPVAVADAGAPRGAYAESLKDSTAIVVRGGGMMRVDTADLHAAAAGLTRAADALADAAGTLRLLDLAVDATAALALLPRPTDLFGAGPTPDLVDHARLHAAIRTARDRVAAASARTFGARARAEAAVDQLLTAAALYDEAERQAEARWYFSPLFVDLLRGGLRALLTVAPVPVGAALGPLVDRADPVIATAVVGGGAWWALGHHPRGKMLGLQAVVRDGAPLLTDEYGIPTSGVVEYNGEALDLAGMTDVQRLALFLAASPLLRLGGLTRDPTNVVASWPMAPAGGRWPMFGTVAPLPGSFAARGASGALPPAAAGGVPLALRGVRLPAAQPVAAPPRTTEALIRDMPLVMDARRVREAGAIQVVTSVRADGSRAHLVICPGTQEWTDNNGLQPHDFLTDLEGVAGAPNAYEASIDAALRQAGVTAEEPIVLAGHSQGGILAAEFASDPAHRGRYDVDRVVTFGSPTAGALLPDDVVTLHVESTDDPVSALDGAANPAGPNRATVYGVPRADQLLPGAGSHMQEAYAQVARDAREQRVGAVVDFEAGMVEVLGYGDPDTVVTATTYQSVRVDPGPTGPLPAMTGGGGRW